MDCEVLHHFITRSLPSETRQTKLMKLSTLSILLGLVMALPQVYGLLKPAGFAAAARKFPRYTPIGYVLIAIATVWFLYNLQQESVADFASMKPVLFALFTAVGIGTCLFVHDFLPVRGLAVLLMLVAKLLVDTARWVDTEWRLVITTLAYVWVVAGMWFTISPWRLRDLLLWGTVNETRVRFGSMIRLGLALLLVVLGLTAIRKAEQRPVAQMNHSAPLAANSPRCQPQNALPGWTCRSRAGVDFARLV